VRILILGGTRFIGPRVIRALAGNEIAVFHRGSTCNKIAGVSNICGCREDLGSYRAIFQALRPDVVLDMIPQNGEDAQIVVDTIKGMTGRLVAVSSGSVYRTFGVMIGTEDAPVDNTPSKEESPLRSRLFPYRASKARSANDPQRWLDHYDKIPAERVFLTQPDIRCSIIRLPMVYGPNDPDHRCAQYLRLMLAQQPIYLQETVAGWRNSRAFVDNVAEAIAQVVLRGAPQRVYNAAELDDFTEAEWVSRIGDRIGWRSAVCRVPDGSGVGRPAINEFPYCTNFAQHLRMDTTRIRHELGYVETVPLEKALESTIRHYT